MSTAPALTRRSKAFLLAVLLFVSIAALSQDMPFSSPPLTIQSGTILTMRVNDALSSDRNQVGDIFSGTLTEPVIVQGIVVARRGQTVAGRVLEAKKAGMVSGVSRLGITLTTLTLADGQNVPLRSQLFNRNGATSEGRDLGLVAGTTATGAVIGAAANWGKGAAIGAGAGAAVGTLGVLFTRGYPTVIYPETVLTFQVTDPVPINTDDAPQAFRAVTEADYPQEQAYDQPQEAAAPPPALVYRYPRYVYDPYDPYYYYPYYGPYGYPYYGYPYFYGPTFGFFFGSPYYYGYGYNRYYVHRPYYWNGGHYYGHGRPPGPVGRPYPHPVPRPVPHPGGVVHRGGSPVYHGGGAIYRGGGSMYRGSTYRSGGSMYRSGSSVYRSGGSMYRGGGAAYRGGGSTYRSGGAMHGGGSMRGGGGMHR